MKEGLYPFFRETDPERFWDLSSREKIISKNISLTEQNDKLTSGSVEAIWFFWLIHARSALENLVEMILVRF